MIDEEETKNRFGYYARDLNPHSSKKIIAVCDGCGEIRTPSKNSYRVLCRRCVLRGEKSLRWKGGNIERKCEICGKIFDVEPSKIRAGKGKYCSQKCFYRARITKTERICPTCGKLFYRKPSQIGNYCSKKCVDGRTKTMLSDRICEICGKKFEVPPSVVKINRGRFCSHECYWFWLSRDKETKKRLREARQKRGLDKNIPEQIFDNINKHNNLNYLYVGNGSLWIGKDRMLNPDFIKAKGEKTLVEVMGDFWHSPLLNHKMKEIHNLEFRRRHYKKYRWKAIFIWESDLKRSDAESFVLKKLAKETKTK